MRGIQINYIDTQYVLHFIENDVFVKMEKVDTLGQAMAAAQDWLRKE